MMSYSTLPEWKQLLLERKRREEEERERREKEEEERLASMPAWKRGIIQRRRAKQEGVVDKERKRPKHGGGVDSDIQTERRPSIDTIGTIQQNPFIRSQNHYISVRKTGPVKEREWTYERRSPHENITEKDRIVELDDLQDGDICRLCDREMGKARPKIMEREKKQGERDAIPTIKAENIIIIEKLSNEIDDWIEDINGKLESEQEKKEMRMGIRDILISEGKMTEICASEVLIIRPSLIKNHKEEYRENKANKKINETSESAIKNEKQETKYGRVSKLLSKFGHKSPCRSKSSESFISLKEMPQKNKNDKEGKYKAQKVGEAIKGAPKRSFSFSERVIGSCDGSKQERRVLERSHSYKKNSTVDQNNEKHEKEEIKGRRCEIEKSLSTASNSTSEIAEFERQVEVMVFSEENDNKSMMERDRVHGEREMEKVNSWISNQEKQTKFQKVANSKASKNVNGALSTEKTFLNGETDQGEGMTCEDKEHQAEVCLHKPIFSRVSEPKSKKKDGQPEDKTQNEENHNDPSWHEKIWDKERQNEAWNETGNCTAEESMDDEMRDGRRLTKGKQDEENQYLKQSDNGRPTMKQDGMKSIEKMDKMMEKGVSGTWSENSTDVCLHKSILFGNKEPSCSKKDRSIETRRRDEEVHDQGNYEPGCYEGKGDNGGQDDLGNEKWYNKEEYEEGGQESRQEGSQVEERQSKGNVHRRQEEERRAERRGSWKAGRPLTRVESLRERIRQVKEKEEERITEAMIMSRQEVALPQTLCFADVKHEMSEEELPVSFPTCSAEQELCINKQRHGKVTRSQDEEEGRQDLTEDIPPSFSSSSSSSPSLSSPPPIIESELNMSRIYNLKPVSARTGVCLNERTSDIQTIKIRPGGQFASGFTKACEPSDNNRNKEISSVNSVQKQVQQLCLKDQEVLKQNNGDPQKAIKSEKLEDEKKPETSSISSTQYTDLRSQTQHIPSTTKTINAPKVTEAITSRPFTIRSASGGPGKRGTTITINPRKPSSPSTPPTPKTPKTTPDQSKKRFPTVEEIQVIGGYQSLARSCLTKTRGSPKMVRVCFDDSQLEFVCTYPSEQTVIGDQNSSDEWRTAEPGKEGKDEEDEEEEDVVTGTREGIRRLLRVDESCRR